MTKCADCVHCLSSNISSDVGNGSVGSLIATMVSEDRPAVNGPCPPRPSILERGRSGFNGGRGMEKLLFLFMSTSWPWLAFLFVIGVNDGDGDGPGRNPFCFAFEITGLVSVDDRRVADTSFELHNVHELIKVN